MIELLIGSIIGTITSLIISEIYFRRASNEMTKEIGNLKSANLKLEESLKYIEDITANLIEDSEIIRKHSVSGTIDDPKYPYK